MIFEERLKKLRNDLGITQKELADKIGVNRTTVGGYETKGKEPSYNTLIKIAKTLNCSLDFLLGYSEENSSTNGAQQISPKLKASYEKLSKREDLQLLFKETEDLNPDSIKLIVRIIDLIKEEKMLK